MGTIVCSSENTTKSGLICNFMGNMGQLLQDFHCRTGKKGRSGLERHVRVNSDKLSETKILAFRASGKLFSARHLDVIGQPLCSRSNGSLHAETDLPPAKETVRCQGRKRIKLQRTECVQYKHLHRYHLHLLAAQHSI